MALLIAAMERCYLGSSSSQTVTSLLSSHHHHKRHFTFAFPFTEPPKFLQKIFLFFSWKLVSRNKQIYASKWFSLFLGNSSNAITNTTTPFYDLCVIWGATTKRLLALLLSLLMEGSQSMQWRRRRGVGSKKGTWCRKNETTHTHTQGRLGRLHFEEAAVSGSNINGKKFKLKATKCHLEVRNWKYAPLLSRIQFYFIFYPLHLAVKGPCRKWSLNLGYLEAIKCHFEARKWTFRPILTRLQSNLIFYPLHFFWHFHSTILTCLLGSAFTSHPKTIQL